MNRTFYGLDKKGSFKVWNIAVYMADHVDHEYSQPLISVSHGQEGGKMTTKTDWVFTGKQGRTPFEQAISEANGKIKKQIDKGYREEKADLESVSLLPMLASDYNKVGHRIKFPCFGSVKYDGVRCLAIKHCGEVRLESRTGQPYEVPHLQEALNEFMYDGEVFDGEIYVHGYALQDITSAVKRTDTQKEVDKAKKKHAKSYTAAGLQQNGPNYEAECEQGYLDAMLIHRLRPMLQMHIFDIPMDGDFEVRLRKMDEVHAERKEYLGEFIEMTEYDIVTSDEQLRQIHHPRSIRDGFEGYMVRNKKGVYESGKRSGDLQKFKTFMDAEFLITDIVEDKQGNAVFVLKNDLNDHPFQCVMGDMGERKVFLLQKGTLKGKWLKVKFQTRYKGTLLPQFPVGLMIREGYAVEGTFVPYD